jgi:phage shock protein A
VCAFIFVFLLTAFIMGDQALMDEVVAEIKAVCAKLEEVEVEIKQARAEHNNEEVAALRTKEEQLRKKEEQLRTKELLLLQRQPGALSSCVPRVHAWSRTHMHVCQRHG